MSYGYQAEFAHFTGNSAEAEKIYDEFISRYENSDQVPWLTLGNFYMEIKKYHKAIKCYENERTWHGKRLTAREHTTSAVLDYIEKQISKAKSEINLPKE